MAFILILQDNITRGCTRAVCENMQNSETESPLANLAATVDGFRQYVNSNHAANSVKDIVSSSIQIIVVLNQ